jgi:ribosomal protein L39E
MPFTPMTLILMVRTLAKVALKARTNRRVPTMKKVTTNRKSRAKENPFCRIDAQSKQKGFD